MSSASLGRARELLAGGWRDSLLRNSLHIMITAASSSGLGYLYWIIAAHLVPKPALGLGGALISAMTICSIIGGLGLSSTFIERLPGRASGHEWNLTVSTGLLIGAAAGAVCGGAAAAVLPFVSPSFDVLGTGVALALFIPGTSCFTVGTLVDYVFVAERSSGGMSARNLAFGVLKIVLLAIPVGTAAAIIPLYASWALAAAMTLGMSFWLISRLRPGVRPTLAGAGSEAKRMSRSMLGHHATNIGGMLPTYILPVLVLARLSPTDNAYFYLTWMLGSVFFMISPSVCASLFAEASHDALALRTQVRRSVLIIAALLAVPALLCVVLGKFVLRIFGSQFPDHAYVLLIILAVSALPDAVTNIAISVLRVQRRLGAAALLNNIIGVIAILGAWFLLPHLGIAGGGVAWLVGQTVGALAVLVWGFRLLSP